MTTMNRIHIHILLLAVLLSFTACGKDFLDKTPDLSVTESDIYASEALIDYAMKGVYTRFKSSNFGGGALSIIGDNRTDDYVNTGNNTYAHSETYMMTVGSTNVMSPAIFQAGYLAINAANTLKENLEQRESLPLSEEKRKRYIANCLFVRDLSWYYLCQIYSQPYAYRSDAPAIPIHTEAVVEPGHNDAALWSIGDIYGQILKDLDGQTLAALPAHTGSFDCTLPSQAAAHMLKQRIYMCMEQWQKAVDEGEAVNGFTLSAHVADMFEAPYYTDETIYSMPFSATERGSGNPAGYIAKAAGYIDTLNMRTGILSIEGYKLPTDRRTAFIVRDPLSDNREVWYQKYDDYTNRLEWIHIFRYAETLLNLAESYYQLGQEEKAAALLHQVRSRSVPTGDVLDVLSLKGDALRTAIYNERRAEFLGEGMRGLDITRRAEDFVHPLFTGSHGVWDTIVVATPSDKASYCWALPEYEVLVNPSVQN